MPDSRRDATGNGDLLPLPEPTPSVTGDGRRPPPTDTNYNIVPVTWADTTATNLLNRFRDIMMDAQKVLAKMEPTERLDFVIQHVSKKTPPVWMNDLEVSEQTRQAIEMKNKCMGHKKRAWNVRHLEMKQWQYCGVHLTEKDDKGYPVEPPSDVMALLDEPLEQDDLLLVIGHALWLMKEADRCTTPAP